MSVRMILRGREQSPARYGAGVRADSIPLPSGGYRAPDHSLEPIKIPQSLRDVAFFIGALLFIAGCGIGFYGFLFVLLITDLR